MNLSEPDLEYLRDNHSGAMITVGGDGVAKAVRVGVALVDGRLWSSGTAGRVRTERLRQDPRCTLFVFDSGFGSMTLESTVTVLDGPDAPNRNLRLFRVMQDRPTGPLSWFGAVLDEADFLRSMVDEQRLLYEFDVQRTYGMH
jgi:hypothetical protein